MRILHLDDPRNLPFLWNHSRYSFRNKIPCLQNLSCVGKLTPNFISFRPKNLALWLGAVNERDLQLKIVTTMRGFHGHFSALRGPAGLAGGHTLG